MKNGRYEFYSTLNQCLIDALIAGLAFHLAYQIRWEWRVPASAAFQMWLWLPAVMLGQVLVSSLLGAYRLLWRYIGLTDALLVARGYVLFSALLLALRLGLRPHPALLRIPLSVIVIDFLLSFTGSIGVRCVRRLLSEAAPGRGQNGSRKRVVLIGAGRAGVMVAKEITSRPDIKAVGFLDDDPKKLGAVINGLKVLGRLDSLEAVAKEHGVEEVIISVARPPRAALKRLWALSEQLPLQIKMVPSLEEILRGGVSLCAFRDVDMNDLLGRDPVDLGLNHPKVAAHYRGKRILITGAGGSIGSELASQLAGLQPDQLILLDKDENGLNDACLSIAADHGDLAVHPVVADIRCPERLHSVFSSFRPQVVFHAAAHKHVHLMEMNPCEAILNNVVGTRNLAEFSAAFGVSRFVFVSTDKAVKPASVMGASKRICEMMVQARRDRGQPASCCVRFGNVVGSRGSVVPLFRRQIARGGPVTVTHSDAQRFLMTVQEAVCLLIQAGSLASSGEIFVLEMGKPVLVRDMARDLIQLSGLQPGRDIQIEITRLRPGEKISELLVDDTTERLLPTGHTKIKIIRCRPTEANGFETRLKALEEAARLGSAPDVCRILGEFDIGFHREEPQNEPEQVLTRVASS